MPALGHHWIVGLNRVGAGLPTEEKEQMRAFPIVLAATAALVGSAAAMPAKADWYGPGWDRHHWHHHHHWAWGPDFVFAPPPPLVYVRPPVVYAPPRPYYPPPGYGYYTR